MKVSKVHFGPDDLIGFDAVELWVDQYFEVSVFESPISEPFEVGIIGAHR